MKTYLSIFLLMLTGFAHAQVTTFPSNVVVNSKVGIGNSVPLATLSVSNATATLPSFQVFASNNPVPVVTVLSNGYVGIGSATPLAPLHVTGAGGIIADEVTATTLLGFDTIIQNSLLFQPGAGAVGHVLTSVDSIGTATWAPPSAGSVAVPISAIQFNSNGLLRGSSGLVYTNGRVGIAIAIPTAPLDVVGNAKFSSNIVVNSINIGKGGGNVADNTIVGVQAGNANTTGAANVFLGYLAGVANTDGYNNVFTGYRAGLQNTSGWQNVFIGYEAGRQNDSGFDNVFIGKYAGLLNTDGSENTFVGLHAGFRNTVGINNTFIGSNTGSKNTTANYNIFIGSSTGFENLTGADNTFVGLVSGRDNQVGNENSFFGGYSGFSNVVGGANIYIGTHAGGGNKAGYNNTYVGYLSGFDVNATSGWVTNFTDYSGTVAGTVRAASPAHGRTTGNILILAGSTNYNGTFTITTIDANSFYFTDTFVVVETNGFWSVQNQGNLNTILGYNTGRGIITGYANTVVGANVSALAAGLSTNIILANGLGGIKAQHNGLDWTLSRHVGVSGTVTASNIVATTLTGTGDHVAVSAGGLFMRTNITGSGGSPGGNSGAIQFAHDGAFAGTTDLLWDRTNRFLTLQGGVQASSISADANLSVGGYIRFVAEGYIIAASDGVWRLSNEADNGWNRLQLGGTTAAFPAIGRTNGDVIVLGANGAFDGTSTNRLLAPGGLVSKSLQLNEKAIAIGDVLVAGATNGQVMFTNSLNVVTLNANDINLTNALGSNQVRLAITNLTDVSVPGRAAGDVLFWNPTMFKWTNGQPAAGAFSGNSNQIPYLNVAGTGFLFNSRDKSAPGLGFQRSANGNIGAMLIHVDQGEDIGLVQIGPPNPASNISGFVPSLSVSNRYSGDGTVTQEMVRVNFTDVDGGSSSESLIQTWRSWQSGTATPIAYAAALRKDGQLTLAHGTYYPSNSFSATMPTAAQLGPGGFWTGVSNNSLVTVYSLNGSATAMKVLAP